MGHTTYVIQAVSSVEYACIVTDVGEKVAPRQRLSAYLKGK